MNDKYIPTVMKRDFCDKMSISFLKKCLTNLCAMFNEKSYLQVYHQIWRMSVYITTELYVIYLYNPFDLWQFLT